MKLRLMVMEKSALIKTAAGDREKKPWSPAAGGEEGPVIDDPRRAAP
jgi:hypothetical protein